MSAIAASSVRRTSTTMSLAPLATARLISAPKTGWVSVVLAPEMKMTSVASSISRIDPEAAAVLNARFIAATELEWQRRVQWSMLLVPKAPRTIRIIA
jgi:hypothetical protein